MNFPKFNYNKFIKYLPAIIVISLIIVFVSLFGVKQKPHPVTTPTTTTTTNTNTKPSRDLTDFSLSIPSLEISAPIIANVNGNDKEAYFKALQEGVAHYQGTALPGEGGNIFIFGHSSYYWWDPGKYKDIFKNLEDIQKGDEIDVHFSGKDYKYKVVSTDVVKPTDTSSLNATSSEQLTLMTCVPPGTATNRLIVVAKPF